MRNSNAGDILERCASGMAEASRRGLRWVAIAAALPALLTACALLPPPIGTAVESPSPSAAAAAPEAPAGPIVLAPSLTGGLPSVKPTAARATAAPAPTPPPPTAAPITAVPLAPPPAAATPVAAIAQPAVPPPPPPPLPAAAAPAGPPAASPVAPIICPAGLVAMWSEPDIAGTPVPVCRRPGSPQ